MTLNETRKSYILLGFENKINNFSMEWSRSEEVKHTGEQVQLSSAGYCTQERKKHEHDTNKIQEFCSKHWSKSTQKI